MEKLKVKNFGAIGVGLEENDEFIEIGKMTLFLGEQGSGKSTITKLLSTFLWLEKALLRGDFSDEELTYEVFVTKYLAWQTIETYIHDNSMSSKVAIHESSEWKLEDERAIILFKQQSFL